MNTVRWNSKQVTIPWHVVGAPEVDLVATIAAVQSAIKAQRVQGSGR